MMHQHPTHIQILVQTDATDGLEQNGTEASVLSFCYKHVKYVAIISQVGIMRY